jgi:hypothetical protein
MHLISYFSEIQGFEDNMSVLGARGIGVRALYVLDVSPLVDEEGFVAVLEPRQVTKPREILRHRTVTTHANYKGNSELQ